MRAARTATKLQLTYPGPQADGARRVEARVRAEDTFRKQNFVVFDTSVVSDDGKQARLDSAPLGWVLSRTTSRILDGELLKNKKAIDTVMTMLPNVGCAAAR